ncbi:hypothetical protein B0H12DRAFT_1231955 [Mycena haematopus]|nr:hypothetical protein B0H12DRAFT_1231955 [Mycena haematopus]
MPHKSHIGVPRLLQGRTYFNLETQLYGVLTELAKTQIVSNTTEIRMATVLFEIRKNARVAGFKVGRRLRVCIVKHLEVASRNQLLYLKPDQDAFTLTYYGIHLLRKHLQPHVDSTVPKKTQVLAITSAVRARLPRLNLRQTLSPSQITILRKSISEALDKEESSQLANLRAFIGAEHSNAQAAHAKNRRLREISCEHRDASHEIRCCESELFVAIATRQPSQDIQARLDTLENTLTDLEHEHDLLTLDLVRIQTSNVLHRDGARNARVTADLVRRAANQVADYTHL